MDRRVLPTPFRRGDHLGDGDTHMSVNLRSFRCISNEGDLALTAFNGGGHGRCIQFSIGDKWVSLSEQQVKRLVETVCDRYADPPNTDSEEVVLP